MSKMSKTTRCPAHVDHFDEHDQRLRCPFCGKPTHYDTDPGVEDYRHCDGSECWQTPGTTPDTHALLNSERDVVDVELPELGVCQWFALCDRAATTTVPHPTLGNVPCCARCAGRSGRA
jgi:hypothetical protein